MNRTTSIQLTPENIRRAKQLERQDIDRLLENYSKAFNAQEYMKAHKISWILSWKYGIEGDRDFSVGSRDFESG